MARGEIGQPQRRTLRSPIRMQVYSLVQKHSGLTVHQLARKLSLTWGTVHYHVARLQAAGLVVSRRIGRSRVILAKDGPQDGLADALAILHEETARRIALTIVENPHRGVLEVMDAAGVSQRVAYYHVKRLLRAGLIASVSPTNHRGLVATPKLFRALDRLP